MNKPVSDSKEVDTFGTAGYDNKTGKPIKVVQERKEIQRSAVCQDPLCKNARSMDFRGVNEHGLLFYCGRGKHYFVALPPYSALRKE